MFERPSHRKHDEMRPVRFTTHYTMHAEGSVLVEVGNTKVICTASVIAGKPKFLLDRAEGWVTAEYGLLPRATHTRCDREAAEGKQSGRTQEIQRLIGRSLRACMDLEKIPDLTITIDADVIQADGGTRTASICGGYLALCEAVERLFKEGKIKENPITEPVAAISAGIVDGDVLLDLEYEEDSHAQVDANIVLTGSGKIIEFQTTAEGAPYEEKQMLEIFNVAKSGIEKIIAKYDLI